MHHFYSTSCLSPLYSVRTRTNRFRGDVDCNCGTIPRSDPSGIWPRNDPAATICIASQSDLRKASRVYGASYLRLQTSAAAWFEASIPTPCLVCRMQTCAAPREHRCRASLTNSPVPYHRTFCGAMVRDFIEDWLKGRRCGASCLVSWMASSHADGVLGRDGCCAL